MSSKSAPHSHFCSCTLFSSCPSVYVCLFLSFSVLFFLSLLTSPQSYTFLHLSISSIFMPSLTFPPFLPSTPLFPPSSILSSPATSSTSSQIFPFIVTSLSFSFCESCHLDLFSLTVTTSPHFIPAALRTYAIAVWTVWTFHSCL